MYRSGYLKKFLVGAVACKSVGVTCDIESGKCFRRSELPIYTPDTCPAAGASSEEGDDGTSDLERGVSAVRKELWVWSDTAKGYKEKVKDAIDTGREHTTSLIESLRQEELPIPRYGAVALSGLTGVILGLRGGWFRRLFYGSTCAAVMAGICYPKEWAKVSQEVVTTTKMYALITYNFVYGVKPEGLTLPSLSKFLGGAPEEPPKEKDSKPAAATVAGKDEGSSADPGKATTSAPINDQSSPQDKDLYSNRS